MLKPLNDNMFEILFQYAVVAAFGIVLLTVLIVLIERVWTQLIYPSLYYISHPDKAQEYSDDDTTTECKEDDHGDYIS